MEMWMNTVYSIPCSSLQVEGWGCGGVTTTNKVSKVSAVIILSFI